MSLLLSCSLRPSTRRFAFSVSYMLHVLCIALRMRTAVWYILLADLCKIEAMSEEEMREGRELVRSGFSVPVLRRKRATAFSYPRMSVTSPTSEGGRDLVPAANGHAAENWRNGKERGGSSESTASDRSMEYTYVNEVPSQCFCGLCGEVRHLVMH